MGVTFDDKQAELVAKFEAELSVDDMKWLNRNVQLVAPELDKADTQTVRQLFGTTAGGINDAGLVRTYLWQSWILMGLGQVEPIDGNLRSFWYQRLEPFYRRHGLVETDLVDENGKPLVLRKKYSSRGEKIVNVMGERMAELVGYRIFRYRDLGFDEPFDHRAKVGRARPRILLVTEKEGLWKYLLVFHKGELEVPSKKPKPAISFKSISVMASNGQPSMLALEYFHDALDQAGVGTLVIGALCDLDPWGYEIALSYTEKLHFMGIKEVTTYLLTQPSWFTPEQIAAGRDLSNLPTAGERALVEKWFHKTGGVNGKRIGLHLDVINKSQLLLKIYDWVKLVLKNDQVPGYPLVTPYDAEEARRALGVRGPLLPDGAHLGSRRTLRNLR
jgi:hypothetical protein